MAKVKKCSRKSKKHERKSSECIQFKCITDCRIISRCRKNDGWFTLISNSFYFGYMQGVKATKAQLKGGAR